MEIKLINNRFLKTEYVYILNTNKIKKELSEIRVAILYITSLLKPKNQGYNTLNKMHYIFKNNYEHT